MVGPKKQDFWHGYSILKGKKFKKFCRGASVRQKVPKSYFQSQFLMSKIDEIKKKKFIEEYQFRRQFFVQTFFFFRQFLNHFVTKIMPNF